MKRFFLFCLVVLLFQGCSRVKTLNLKKHQFSRVPQKIIWIQVAGLRPEHLSMLKFSRGEGERRLSIEKSDCVGTIWNYNLFKLRPDADSGFLSQILGSKNIQNQCSDFKGETPFWERFGREEYRVGIFDTGRPGSFYQSANQCREEASSYLDQTTFWRMLPKPNQNAKYFHYQNRKSFEEGQIYYDQSCKNSKTCYASLYSNVTSVWKRFSEELSRSVFIVQDFSYLRALKRKNISRAREILTDVEKLFSFFEELQSNESGVLVLLSSSESYGMEFPYKGESWSNFEKFGRNILYKRPSLNSFVYASGASSENFCGQFGESEISERVIWKTEDKEFFFFNL